MPLFRSRPDISAKLDNVRALAALGVMFYHYFIFFFIEQNMSARLSCFPPLDFSSSSFVEFLKGCPFDLGRFAVTFFFLMSGFLTPYLLEKYPTRSAFFGDRFFRLWPIYAVGLGINLLFIWGACEYNDMDFPFEFSELLCSFFAARDIAGYPFITGIVWTFEVEVKFILFCLIFYPLIQKASLKPLTIIIAVLFAGCYFVTNFMYDEYDLRDFTFTFFKAVGNNLRYFPFLLMGMSFYFLFTNKISKKTFVGLCTALSLLFALGMYLTVKPHIFVQYIVSYFPALALFIWYINWQFSKTQTSSVLGFIARMSYPLYLIHAIPGYIITYILHEQGIPLLIGMGIACIPTFGISYLAHRLIEQPIRNAWHTYYKNAFPPLSKR